jgi:hypothetical protein
MLGFELLAIIAELFAITKLRNILFFLFFVTVFLLFYRMHERAIIFFRATVFEA